VRGGGKTQEGKSIWGRRKIKKSGLSTKAFLSRVFLRGKGKREKGRKVDTIACSRKKKKKQ